jgi:uncharacterized repeat protein (TIGR03803 family)
MRCTSVKTIRSLAIFIAILTFAGSALGSTEKVIYNFKGGSDGANPFNGLVTDTSGNLYGTTGDGGGTNCNGQGCGTVFQLAPPAAQGGAWTETVLYSFQGGTDAAGPEASLIFDSVGNLYGTTYGGGTSNEGAVFQLKPPATQGGSWTETVLYSFKGGRDGEYPVASLIFDTAGNLYGTTVFGGLAHAGVVFQLAPPATQGGAWTETVIHTFGMGRDGLDPMAGLVLDGRGALYGTTLSGIAFKLTPPVAGQGTWRETMIYNFTGGGNNGSEPCALIRGKNGVLYGTTLLGGSSANAGTVFQLTPPTIHGGSWTETTLYAFTGQSDGGLPCGTLVADQAGNLYGTTSGNGANIPGTVFQLTPPATQGGAWTETTLHDFTGGHDGLGPAGGVIFGNGRALYGVTGGGGRSGHGTVFQVEP